jgi:hypothetical protein
VGSQAVPGSMRRWEREVAETFLTWRHDETCRGEARLRSMCAAVSGTVKDYVAWGRVSGEEIARRLPDALAACDTLDFREVDEALAYLVLHLTDRYGRVTEVLEQLLRQGHLPVRRTRTKVLDVGAGPAPGVYATVDLYDDFADWIASTEQKVTLARVTNPDVLDAGPAWDQVLHGFSERLLVERRGQPGEQAARLPFRRTYSRQVQSFSVHEEHHAWRAWLQRQILQDFDMADEGISDQAAWQLAYQEPAAVPSAYDLIILCNFLTNTQMTEHLTDDLFRLSRSLTPGGVLLVLGGTGASYPAIYTAISEIAGSAGLTPVSSLLGPITANASPVRRALIAEQIRGDVAYLAAATPSNTWSTVRRHLPADAIDPTKPFKLPRFQALAFQQVFPGRGKDQGRSPRGVPHDI